MSNIFQSKLDAIKEKRSTAAPLPTMPAPTVSSHEFRVGSKTYKYKAQQWDHHFSIESRSRLPATLKLASSARTTPDAISLGTARPNYQYYPWDRAIFESPIGSVSDDESWSHVETSSSTTKASNGLNLAMALNYGFAAGSGHVLRFITEHVEMLHDPPYEDWETCLTCGTTSALDILFRIFLQRGEPLIVEENTYTGTIEAARALGIELISVHMDSEGLSSQGLEELLVKRSSTGQKIPSVLYTIPCGHNPTGITQSKRRRKEIYRVAELYDLIIIEDDPYHLLQLGSHLESVDSRSTSDEYITQLPGSFLSMDTSGRVVRLETASKILAPGLRCGWMTASSQIVQKFISYTDTSTGSVSGPTQLMLFSLLECTWGHAGFLQWLIYLSRQYRIRRDKLLECCMLHLPREICHWNVPTEGMFIWIEIQLPNSRTDAIEHNSDIEDRIYNTARATGVVVSKGSWFRVSSCQPSHNLHFRLTFAAAPIESFDLAVKRFGEAIRKVLEL